MKTTFRLMRDNMISVNTDYDFNTIFYDTELYVYISTLAKNLNDKFDTNFIIPNEIEDIANWYKGRKVHGNNQKPLEMYITGTWYQNRYKLLSYRQYDDCKFVSCCAYGNDMFTKEQLINFVESGIEFLKTSCVLKKSFENLITYYDMRYLSNAYSVALGIIRDYKQFVDITDGVKQFNEIMRDKGVQINYPILYQNGMDSLANELNEYGLK